MHSDGGRRTNASMCLCSLTLLGAALVLVWWRHGPRSAADPAAAARALLIAGGPVALAGTGCDNWKEVALGEITNVGSFDKCRQKCHDTAGCVGFNYQPADCDRGDSSGKGACLLTSAPCTHGQNECWYLFEGFEPFAPIHWSLQQASAGCTNWQEIAIRTTVELNVNACGVSCANTPGCVGFNFQASDCSQGEALGQGSCIHYNGTCNAQENTCWELWTMGSPVTAPGASELAYAASAQSVAQAATATATSAELAANQEVATGAAVVRLVTAAAAGSSSLQVSGSGVAAGSYVLVGRPPAAETAVVAEGSAGSLVLSKGLAFGHPAGTAVSPIANGPQSTSVVMS